MLSTKTINLSIKTYIKTSYYWSKWGLALAIGVQMNSHRHADL